MTVSIKAHFDGAVIVPDEPVELPVNQPLRLSVSPEDQGPLPPDEIQRRLRALRAASGSISAPPIPPEALRRENLYDE